MMGKTERNVDGETYECVNGMYYRDGSHVLLDDRPEKLVSSTQEKIFRGKDGVLDVTVQANLISVYTTREVSKSEVTSVLQDGFTGDFWYEGQSDVSSKYQSPAPATNVFRFKYGSRGKTRTRR